jgi:O-ureido-D-serine cyclo-ligase
LSPSRCDVAIVTYRELLDLFPDDRPLAAALAARGLAVEVVAWDDPQFDWSTARLALLRSPWDYYRRPAEFRAWAERAAAATRMVNPVECVRWNLDKRYLLELEGRGAPVVPGALLPAGRVDDLAAVAGERGWGAVVVKPTVSADSWEATFVAAGDFARGQAHVARLQPERDLLVQPFLAGVESYGERCLVFVEGELSHAVRKNALTRGGRWAGEPEGVRVEPTPEEVAAATRVLALALPAAGVERPLYARVDLVPDGEGRPRLLELELVEPTLFFEAGPLSALERFVAGVERRLSA